MILLWRKTKRRELKRGLKSKLILKSKLKIMMRK